MPYNYRLNVCGTLSVVAMLLIAFLFGKYKKLPTEEIKS